MCWLSAVAVVAVGTQTQLEVEAEVLVLITRQPVFFYLPDHLLSQ
jgi:hypothetical protein